MIGIKVPGACGELVQGIHNGQFFLVTCPIDIYDTVFYATHKTYIPHKMAQARKKTLSYLKKDAWINLRLQRQLFCGKGMASSSADIAGVIQLVAKRFNRELTEEEIAKIAISIEPTDGIFCRGVVKFDYRQGEIIERWGNPPAIQILVFDCGGTVNTIRFNRRHKLEEYYLAHEQEITKALDLVKTGMLMGDYNLIGRGAALSAYANQGILPKSELEEVMVISEGLGGIGVNVAHSGTVMGVMFAPEESAEVIEACKAEILGTCQNLQFLKKVTMISGGMYIEECQR